MTTSEEYLVWSNEHRGWWKKGMHGYSYGLDDAQAFSRDEALRICRDSIPDAGHLGIVSELPVRLADVREFLEGALVPEAIFKGGR